MSEKNQKSPDESWDAVSKGNTRDTQSGVEKNTKKPDDARVKGEISDSHHGPEEDEAE
jgi:hypothetical protein